MNRRLILIKRSLEDSAGVTRPLDVQLFELNMLFMREHGVKSHLVRSLQSVHRAPEARDDSDRLDGALGI
jgi:hypothetical protein